MDDDRRRATGASRVAAGARDIGEVALQVPEVQRAVLGILLIPLSVVFVPLGLTFLLLSAFLYGALFDVLNLQPGGLSTALGLGWWIGTLVVMFFLFRRTYRWLAARFSLIRRMTAIGFGDSKASDRRATTGTARIARSNVNASTGERFPEAPSPTLAELDARLATRPAAKPAEPGS